MRSTFIRSLAIGSLIPLAASCGGKFPASPVPAALGDLEAARLADAYQVSHRSPPMVLISAEQQPNGHRLAYETLLHLDEAPPKESHLFIVRNDGSVRELTFEKNR